MSQLTNLIQAEIAEDVRTLTGRTLTRPSLFVIDGVNDIYVVNVDVGDDAILTDVAIATGNNELRYADAGAPVTLVRTRQGTWMVTGFSKIMPGSYIRLPVGLPDFEFGLPEYTLGTAENLTNDVRPLTLGELGTIGPGFGRTPLGAMALYRGGVFVRII